MMAIDANIAAKWYLPEDGSALALALLRNPNQLIAPALIKLEVCAAFTRRVRQQEIQAEEALEHCQEWYTDLREDAVQLVPEADILERAIELSLQIRHPLQDCLYLAVAERAKIPLITADEPFCKKAVAFYPETHLLSKWRMN